MQTEPSSQSSRLSQSIAAGRSMAGPSLPWSVSAPVRLWESDVVSEPVEVPDSLLDSLLDSLPDPVVPPGVMATHASVAMAVKTAAERGIPWCASCDVFRSRCALRLPTQQSQPPQRERPEPEQGQLRDDLPCEREMSVHRDPDSGDDSQYDGELRERPALEG